CARGGYSRGSYYYHFDYW
nr:immunoglobulin heavy chain junction region [Macaca mulatta]MOX91621.1 immunoglobulin heavy chain junction region [Macaca mulatta]MOX91727.1 immunoglobulin heavy chain junction region [Macaca mulatta]MOX91859.1 immunoglobulin heavy chain junction region [Macaca mulatta]MOX92081.1 immunoglobulin heavy chain junction region [Macaca mulatta]